LRNLSTSVKNRRHHGSDPKLNLDISKKEGD